jgi:hypothetical protein
MWAVRSSKALVSTYKSTQHFNPEDKHGNLLYCHGNLKSHMMYLLTQTYYHKDQKAHAIKVIVVENRENSTTESL